MSKYTDIVGFIVLSHCNEITFLKGVFNKKDIHEKVLCNDYQELKYTRCAFIKKFKIKLSITLKKAYI